MKFTPIVALILGAILTAAEAIQLTVIPMSSQLHLGLTELIAILVTAGVLAATPAQIAAVVPHQVLIAITALIGFLQAFQGDFAISQTAHRVIAIVLVGVGALFTSGGSMPTITGAAEKHPVGSA